ncbi:Mitochondrial inner membrane protein oxa1l [Podila humilis]|nr:Mitochondrial inner membrane protein oxa1l [Podila humilis]
MLRSAQPALSAAVRQYAAGKTMTSLRAGSLLRSTTFIRSAAGKQQSWAPIFGAGSLRLLSTETSSSTKAAFIDPTVAIASTQEEQQPQQQIATTTEVIPTPTTADITNTVSEDTLANTLSSTQEAISQVAAQNSDNIASAAMKYGDLKAMGLVNFSPVGGLETILEAVHISTGLPWWATIATTTVAIRTLLIPFIVKLQGNTARLHNVKPQLERLTENMKLAKESNDTAALARFSAQTQELFAKNDCNPIKSLVLPLIQAPIMISFYLALRDMANLPVPQFKEGGLGWFTDLTIADPTYVLPVASSLGFLAIMELGSEAGGVAQPKTMKNVMRGMAVLMIPLTMNFPSAIFVYWLTSNVFTASQIMFFKAPAVRRFFNIPQLLDHPKPKVQAKQAGFMESFKASYEGGLAAKQKEIAVAKDRENKMSAQKARRQNRKRI